MPVFISSNCLITTDPLRPCNVTFASLASGRIFGSVELLFVRACMFSQLSCLVLAGPSRSMPSSNSYCELVLWWSPESPGLCRWRFDSRAVCFDSITFCSFVCFRTCLGSSSCPVSIVSIESYHDNHMARLTLAIALLYLALSGCMLTSILLLYVLVCASFRTCLVSFGHFFPINAIESFYDGRMARLILAIVLLTSAFSDLCLDS